MWSLAGYGISFPLAFLSSTLAARVLGPGGRGELAAMMALPMLLPYLSMLGGGHAVTYYTARRPDAVGRYLGTAAAAGIAASVIVGVIAWPFQSRLLGSFDAAVRASGLFFLLFVPVNTLFALPYAAFQGLGRFAEFNFIRVFPQIVYVAALGLAWLLGRRASAFVVDSYLLMSALIGVPIAWGLYFKRIRRSLSADRSTAREMSGYGLYSMLSNLPTTANRNIDQIFIAALLPSRELGWYAVAATWGSLLTPVVSAVGSVLFPRLAGSGEISAHPQLRRQAALAAVAIIAASALLYALTPLAVPLLFGAPFKPAVEPGRILVMAGAFLAFNIILSDALRGLGRPRVIAAAETVALALTLGGLIPALRERGILGAAWLSLLSYASAGAVMALALWRDSKPLHHADPPGRSLE